MRQVTVNGSVHQLPENVGAIVFEGASEVDKQLHWELG